MNSSKICPLGKMMSVANLISKRWTLLIFKSLCDGATTFSSIRKQYPTLSARVLTERLRDLTQAKYITRTEGKTHLDVRYTLSSKGIAFKEWLILGLENWISAWENDV